MEHTTGSVIAIGFICLTLVACSYIFYLLIVEWEPEPIQMEECSVTITKGQQNGFSFSNKTIICPPLGVNLNE